MKNSRFSFLRRPIFWIALAILAFVTIGAYFYFNQPNARAPQTAVVSRGDIKATVNANARVRAEKSARLAFPFSGLIRKVLVQVGEDVQHDEGLIEMDSSELERRFQQALANLDARQDDLNDAGAPPQAPELEMLQLTLKKAALVLAGAEQRYKDNASDENRIAQELAQIDYDLARANFERQIRGVTPSQRADLEHALQSARFDYDAAQEALNKTTLRAPFYGIITDITAKPGEYIGGYTAVAEIADLATLQLFAEIDEIDVAEVNAGQPVEIRFDAFPGEVVQGTLSRLYPAASNERGATVYNAIISPEHTELKLRPGMGATITIATLEKKNVLRVPARAIKNAGTQKIVMVKEGNTTRNVVVQTGVSDGNETEILDGVSEGMIVVIE